MTLAIDAPATREDVLDHFRQIQNPGSNTSLIRDEPIGAIPRNYCPLCGRINGVLRDL